MERRVVITGMGVVSPNGVGVDNFLEAIRKGKSGIRYDELLEEINFSCKVSGRPSLSSENLNRYLSYKEFNKIENDGLKYACLAGTEAWLDAKLELTPKDELPDTENGIIFGTGALAMGEFIYDKMLIASSGKPRHTGPRLVEQTMNSAAASYLNRIIGFGNILMSNSNACSTGTEAVILGFERIKAGKATRMLCGSTEVAGWVIWTAFEAIRILCSDSNEDPEKASRPMASNAAGIVPGSGAGALVIEELDSALERGAPIYAEIVSGNMNTGGFRNGGSMTNSNYFATKSLFKQTLNEAKINGTDIDLICGHLTATMADPYEVNTWKEGLDLSFDNFPMINSLKSMTGHCFSATGSIEMVASALQLHHQFVHPNLNIDEIHPDISSNIRSSSIVKSMVECDLNYIMKANLAFGDVNTCLILKKWND